MGEIEIIHIAVENLKKTAQINGEWIHLRDAYLDGKLKLLIDNKNLVFNAVVKKELRNHQLGQIEKMAEMYHPFIIVAERIFPKIKEQLRTQNIAYLEASGNVFFNQMNFHYFIETQNPIANKKEKINRAFTKTGLKVLFHFLVNEKWTNLPHREIAEITQVAHGNIAYILNGLKENKFLFRIDKNTFRLNNKKELLEKWMVAWKETLQPALKIGRFRFADEKNFTHYRELHLDENTTWWGGEPAGDILTNYLRPGELILYTTKNRNELMKEYRLMPDPNGDVKIYRAFWLTKEAVRNNTVHPVLVYADLMNTGNNRCYETAQMIWDKYLAHEF
ncbi:MAG: type IV toxin-antitoxin system AbiEi family antitoxin [Bacteroidales bacterium]|nr:type IV toxin-antitoxin system AbiEi family antitoxin [Bacteroidales bacterium]